MSDLVQAAQVSNPEDPYRDCAVTINNIIEDHKTYLAIKKAYDHDPWLIPIYPSTAIEFVESPEKVSGIGSHPFGGTHESAFDFQMLFHIWYYHEKISKQLHDAEMQTKLAALNRVFKEHPTINCYAGPGWALVKGVVVAAREREELTLFGGYIELMVPRRICYTHNPNCV